MWDTVRSIIAALAIAALAANSAQSAADISTIVAARAAVDSGNWKAAIDPLRKLVRQSPQNGEFRLSLALAHYLTDDIDGAEADYKIAFDLKSEDPAILAYGIVKCDIQLGRKAEAMTWLRKAISLGYRRIEDARIDDPFAPLRTDPEYRWLLGLPDTGLSRRWLARRYPLPGRPGETPLVSSVQDGNE